MLSFMFEKAIFFLLSVTTVSFVIGTMNLEMSGSINDMDLHTTLFSARFCGHGRVTGSRGNKYVFYE